MQLIISAHTIYFHKKNAEPKLCVFLLVSSLGLPVKGFPYTLEAN